MEMPGSPHWDTTPNVVVASQERLSYCDPFKDGHTLTESPPPEKKGSEYNDSPRQFVELALWREQLLTLLSPDIRPPTREIY